VLLYVVFGVYFMHLLFTVASYTALFTQSINGHALSVIKGRSHSSFILCGGGNNYYYYYYSFYRHGNAVECSANLVVYPSNRPYYVSFDEDVQGSALSWDAL